VGGPDQQPTVFYGDLDRDFAGNGERSFGGGFDSPLATKRSKAWWESSS